MLGGELEPYLLISEQPKGPAGGAGLDCVYAGHMGCGALGGTRTPNLLIRSQMLYPLSYERIVNPAQCTALPSGRAGSCPAED
jgi:hypothetical protein